MRWKYGVDCNVDERGWSGRVQDLGMECVDAEIRARAVTRFGENGCDEAERWPVGGLNQVRISSVHRRLASVPLRAWHPERKAPRKWKERASGVRRSAVSE